MNLYRVSCCGVREMGGLSEHANAKDAMKVFCETIYREVGEGERYTAPNATLGVDTYKYPNARFRYVVFTQANNRQSVNAGYTRAAYGDRFAAFIAEHGLGDVVTTEEAMNPNSGNHVQVFLWTVDHDALLAWMKKSKIKAIPYNGPTTNVFGAASAVPQYGPGDLHANGNGVVNAAHAPQGYAQAAPPPAQRGR